MQGMIDRWITHKLKKTIDNRPVVALLGARQVGKTTLAQKISSYYSSSIYLDLESPEDLLKLSDPISFLSSHKDKLIILDEIQNTPDIFKVLRGIIDKNKTQGRRTSQFLILGSASMELLRQSQSLAGRISYIEMGGLNILEIPNKKKEIQKLWLRGGFPESYLCDSNESSMEWLEDLIRTYLQRDIPQMGFKIPATRLRRLWTMLAHLQGETINYSQIGGNLEIDSKTIRRYMDIFVDLLLIRRLEPWSRNAKKRMIKSPRFYIRDSGIQHRLLGIHNYENLLSNPILGKSWEAFVIENIHSILPQTAQTYFYRTRSGSEIDLLIQFPSEKIWAVEIKYGVAPKVNKNFYITCQEIKATRRYIIYGGDDEFSINNDIKIISLGKFMNELNKQAKS